MLRATTCVLVFASVTLTAQAPLVTYHDLSSMTTWTLGNMQAKGALGQTASLAIAEMPTGVPGRAGSPHHHQQEQIVVGVSGSTLQTIAGMAYRLGTYGAVVMPANSHHAGFNGLTTGPSTFIEFQPVVRTDWFPPHPKTSFPQSESPVPVPGDQRVFDNLDPSSSGWQSDASGARSKILGGQTVRVTMWDLSVAGAAITLSSQGARPEQFVYVFEGKAQMTVDANLRVVGAQTLAVISPAAKDVRLSSAGNGRTLIAVFEALSR